MKIWAFFSVAASAGQINILKHDPTCTNGGMQNKSSVEIWYTVRTHCIHFLDVWRWLVYAQSVLINKISALELSRKFIKGALLVGDANQSKICTLTTMTILEIFSLPWLKILLAPALAKKTEKTVLHCLSLSVKSNVSTLLHSRRSKVYFM